MIRIVFIIMLSSFLSYSQDTVKCFTIEEQKQILTKFEDLNECEELRRLDSLKIVITENELNNMTYDNIQLKGRVNKLRGNVVKFSVLSFAVGILTTIFVLK